MERDGVDPNLIKVAKTKFDGTSDVGVGLLMYNCKSMPTKWLGFHFSVSWFTTICNKSNPWSSSISCIKFVVIGVIGKIWSFNPVKGSD